MTMCSIIFKNKDLNQSTHKTLPDIIEIKKKKKISKPCSITNFRVIENSIILKYMLGKRIPTTQEDKITLGVYTPKLKLNNVLIVIQK